MSTNIWVVDWRRFHPTLAIQPKPSIFGFVYGDFIQSKIVYYLELGAQEKTDKALSVPSSTFFEQFWADSKTWLWKVVPQKWQFQFWSVFKISNVKKTMSKCYFVCWRVVSVLLALFWLGKVKTKWVTRLNFISSHRFSQNLKQIQGFSTHQFASLKMVYLPVRWVGDSSKKSVFLSLKVFVAFVPASNSQ